MRGNKFTVNDFFCTTCGVCIPLPRQKSQKREGGHLKKIYCYVCNEEKNFVECTDSTYTRRDFFDELNKKNFSEEGKRKENYYGKES